MKVKGRWEHLLAAGWWFPVSARRSDRPRGVGGSSCVPVGWVSGGICAARSARRSCRRCCQALGCRWARVTDEAKRRRQELVVCRAALPFEGLIYARSSVALAPTLLAGASACWSWTMRLYDASSCSASSRSAVRISWLVDQTSALRGAFLGALIEAVQRPGLQHRCPRRFDQRPACGRRPAFGDPA